MKIVQKCAACGSYVAFYKPEKSQEPWQCPKCGTKVKKFPEPTQKAH